MTFEIWPKVEIFMELPYGNEMILYNGTVMLWK